MWVSLFKEMPMKAVYDPSQARHNPQFFLVKGRQLASTEQPERAIRLLEGLKQSTIDVVEPENFGRSPLEAIHTQRYLRFLQSAHPQWQELPNASDEVVANIHPIHQPANYPESIVGRAGWHMADTACPLGPNTWEAACCSANTALTATQMVLDGARFSYALCRPPGHHAYADVAGGFCFLNNVAIAAQHALADHPRVAILDIDVHHGNGTQGIFYQRSDVLTVSIHADPNQFYPFFWGHAAETGAGAGEGCNLNLPLPLMSGDDIFLQALQKAGQALSEFKPGLLLIALGLDASETDPLRGLSVTTQGFHAIGQAIAGFELPTVFVQEGGYLSDILSDNLSAVLSGAQAGESQ